MKKTKPTSELFSLFRMKRKTATLTMGALLACYGINAQNGTDANLNTRWGYGAMLLNCSPIVNYENTALGYSTLVNNCGNMSTAVGANSMVTYTTGNKNSALGHSTLYSNTSGSNNCAVGNSALYSNLGGSQNVAIGMNALVQNTSGNWNVASGIYSLQINTSGQGNSGIGAYSNTYNTTGSYNTALGYNAGPSTGALSNTTAIGKDAVVTVSNKIRLGNASVTVIEGAVAFTPSDGRFKTNISESDVKGLDFIKKLRPVVYNFDTKKLDEFWRKDLPANAAKSDETTDFTASTAIRQSGFIAQEVEIAAKEVGYNFNGLHVPENGNDNYSLAYGQFVVPLVKAVQELSAQNEEQKLVNDALKKELEELKTLVKNISSGNVITPAESTESMLYQNAPNPSNESTTIKYAISPLIKKATLKIVGMNGSTLKEIDVTGNRNGVVEIHAGEFAPGNYVYSLIIDNKIIDSKKMTLTK
jgi:hypothetical protein